MNKTYAQLRKDIMPSFESQFSGEFIMHKRNINGQWLYTDADTVTAFRGYISGYIECERVNLLWEKE